MKNETTSTPQLRSTFKFLTDGKVYLINPKFQYRFMASVVLITIFCMATIYAANYYFFETFIDKGQKLNLPADHSFFLIIKQQKEFMSKVFLGVSLILSGVTSIWGLFYSHRIAGPLYRLNLYFRSAQKNREESLPPVKFRENDFFQEIPDAINTYLQHKNIDNLKKSNEAPPTFKQKAS